MSNLFEQLQATLGGAYRLERELGGGGMSRVFLAQEVALGRNVVIKVLLPELAAGVSVDRFRREIQFAAQLQHPHIVPLLSAGESNGLPFFTMPFISGETLGVKLARTGQLPINETVRILRDVASALAYAHGEGIMHRDVKPGNVLISSGVAVVTDFGVAKALSVSAADPSATHLTSLGVALGTPAYMAPEQASGDPQVDHRADIYALGVVTYEMLAGRTPFWGRATSAVLAAHVIEEPEPIDKLRPGMPAMLATLVMQCLAKRAADRPQSAGEVMHVLDAISTPSGGTASTTVLVTPGPKTRRFWAGRGATLVLGSAAAALLIGGAVLWGRRELRDSGTVQRVGGQTGRATSTGDSISNRLTRDSSVREESRALEPQPAPAPLPPPELPRPKPTPRSKAPATTATPKPAVPHSRDTARALGDATERATLPESVAQAARPAPAPIPQPVPPETTATESVVPQPAPPPAPQPAPDPAPEIRSVLAAFGTAVESENVENIRRLYPGMTAAQQRGWQQFFETVRDVKARFSVSGLDVANGAAEAQLTGTYTYLNSSTRETERRPVTFRMSLRRDPGGWKITQVR